MGLIKAMFTLDVDTGMSDRDRITLSPIEKWRQYKRFPFKLIVHAMLLALTTIQVRAMDTSQMCAQLHLLLMPLFGFVRDLSPLFGAFATRLFCFGPFQSC